MKASNEKLTFSRLKCCPLRAWKYFQTQRCVWKSLSETKHKTHSSVAFKSKHKFQVLKVLQKTFRPPQLVLCGITYSDVISYTSTTSMNELLTRGKQSHTNSQSTIDNIIIT